ncbi:MAG TPA: S8 family serine peptidase [Candidatus Cloacimonadota bacterium]|jgi:subtilisin family serine protease|nr:S8 family serine peptidase [Candidatus Cloacimonadota bacterium]HPB08460.1 S8 family serine peptidase [Candidatus Cloacimonadota bacterium]HQP17345.1 S8 family serine peptidase [Candidatus Cloacimonadota bacterium]HRS49095.1 S8 family serine peptidase [Candidatus Cloacimonadota bacterium]
MRRLAILVAICLALLSVGLMALGPDFADLPFIDIYKVPDGAMVPGHIWIRLKPELSSQLQRLEHTNGTLSSFGIAELDELSRRFEVSKINQLFYSPAHRSEFAQRHRDWGLHLWYEISFASKADIRDIVMAYRGLEGSVEWAEPEYKKVLYESVVGQDQEAPETLDRWTPNDPYYSSQWHYNNTGQQGGTVDCDIDLPEAWDLEKGHQDVIVAVIDEGVQTNHTDLNNNIWSGVGYNFVSGSSTINPGDHGTHVAGTIAAENNNSTGVCGIAGGDGNTKGVSLMSCQVFDGQNQGGFANAPVWAADNGAAVSQNSWGYDQPDVYNQSELTAINYFNANGGGTVLNGGITIFAAGNDEAEGNFYPGCYNGAFAVAATTNQDRKAYYSNWGTWVDISAPGGETIYYSTRGILSTITGNSYAWYQGTSMACPHVSGAAALIISYAHRNGLTLTNTELKTILQNTADNHYGVNPSYTNKLGSGRLNLYNALLAVQPPLNPPQNLAATSTHASVTLTWNAPEAMTPNSYKVYRNSSYLATTGNLTYTDLNVTDGVTYSYYVVASYNNGDSGPSNTVTATPNTFPPTNLTAVGGDTVVNLSWTAAGGRGAEEEFLDERNISGYRIYRNGSSLTTVTGTSYSDHSVVNGTTYSYWVTTLYSNPTGESAASNTAEATPQAVSFAVIGSGTGTTATTEGCPINIYKKSLHGQSVYTAAELNAAGLYGPTDITQLGFYVATAPALALPNFRMRMKHTTATDVANWISADELTTVYSSASYQPVAGDWDLLILSTPFAWNGIDNIVIDTDFDRVATESATGTVRYTNMSNGYRYGRSTYSDMGDTFTGGLVSVYRPDVKLGFVYVEPAGPEITVDPLSLNYGEVEVGQTSVKQFTIHSTGDETLSGSITTPAGYTVSVAGRKGQKNLGESRNTLSFSLPVGTHQTYNLSFNPTAVATYSGNVTINSNDVDESTVLIAVTGTGYTPANISLSGNSLSATLVNGTQGTDSFTIINSGSQSLSFSLAESPSVTWFSAAPSSGTVSGGGNQIITGTFSPEGLVPGTYNTTLLVNSNDPDSPQLPVSVQLVVQNSSPTINAPESLTFDIYANPSLIEDFSPYVDDLDSQTLTLDYSGNSNILVSIDGLTVTFSSLNYWTGTEEITFSVHDGMASAYDTISVTITQIMYPPTNLIAQAGNRVVNLSWTAPDPAGVSGYRIYRDGQVLTDLSGTTYSDANVSNGVTYQYYVTTLYANPTGESAASNTAEATPMAIINVTLGDGSSATNTNEGCPINIFRRSLHGQSVYTAAELNAAGVYGPVEITALGFYVESAPNLALPSFVVRMKHTTDANVASWQSSTGMVTVYSATSYMPTPGGYDMLTLDSPFTWNGTDNIVIDTAFNRVSSRSSTGTVRYTETASGYRYTRSDYLNQTNTFSGGSVSVYRPNVQLTIYGGEPAPPEITVDPLALDFGAVKVGNSVVRQFTIANSGEEDLTGSITTPAGYGVVEQGRNSTDTGIPGRSGSNLRNTLEFSLAGGASAVYQLTFQPLEAIAYNGNVTITSNDADEPTVNIALTGSGYIPPTVSLDATALEATLAVNAQGTDSFNIANLGSQNLSFTLVEDPAVAWFSANPTSGTVAGYGSQLVTGSFTAAGLAPGTYTANLLVNTNDPDDPQLTLTLSLEVLNALPVIDLPADLSFNMNSSLVEDFSGLVSDPDGHDLTLGYSGNTNILVSIEGYTVTFSAPLDWFGSEEITFSVFDGYDYAYDTVTVTVLLTHLAVPQVTVQKSSSGVTVSWEAVTNANCYHIYRATDPYGDYGTQPFATVLAPQTSWEDTEALPMAFYKVVAAYEDLPVK